MRGNQQAGLWEGLFIDLHGETRYGRAVNGNTGGLMPVNTAMLFPVPNEDQVALTAFKITQALSESFAVFAGKINTLDEYRFDQFLYVDPCDASKGWLTVTALTRRSHASWNCGISPTSANRCRGAGQDGGNIMVGRKLRSRPKLDRFIPGLTPPGAGVVSRAESRRSFRK